MAKRSQHLGAVVLAAGHGKRIKSRLPKVLQPLAGRPVLWHVLNGVKAVRPDSVFVVIRERGNEIEEEIGSWDLRLPIEFVVQAEPHGTGHAVMAAEHRLASMDEVLVVNGDEPLVTGQQLKELVSLRRRRKAAAAVQTTIPHDPKGFARVIRDGDELVRLAEGSDASAEDLVVTEVATGAYAFSREDLFRALPLVTRDNSQREYYLPDILGILREKGERLVVQLVEIGGAVGVNSRTELARATTVMRRRINDNLMAAGVTILDPDQTYVDIGVRVGRDTTLLPQTILEGATRIGEGCTIGPASRISSSTIADGALVEQSVVRESAIGPRASVGPYSHIRPETVLGADARVGSFVEIKASRIGEGSKVPHLSYIGDATIGRNVNVGAGTITVNYDGYEKHRTIIGDDVRIGSDTMLVAPVRIGRGAVTGAGSVITKDVPAGTLAVERAEQRHVSGYRQRKDDERGESVTSIKEIVTKKRMMLFSGTAHPELAEEIAVHLGVELCHAKISRFASGEIYFRAEESVRGSDVFVIQTHADPVNESVMEQLVILDALKRASAKRITAVVPYYGYSRQDKKEMAREPISAKLLADLITVAGADRVVSVDLHSGQIQGYFDFPFDHLTALPLLSDYISSEAGLPKEDVVVVAPDAGRIKVAERLRESLDSDLAFIYKRRSKHTAHKIDEMVVEGDVDGRVCVLVDDMIDTGGTMVEGARALQARGAREIVIGATHAVLSGKAVQRLEEAPFKEIIVTNTLPIPEEKRIEKLTILSIAPIIASALQAVFEDESVSEIFHGENQP